ncbi:MAG: hypothetical protein H7281_18095 [Bacteriovorax sp.]|nr:hypothetical protein [Bacteriovorax sp.]
MDNEVDTLTTITASVKVDTITTPADKAEGDHHGAVEAPTAPPGPQIINGVKVYPTSYIPVKAVLHFPKKSLIAMELEHIEGIHIAFFLGLTVFLFIGMWKRPNLR